MIGTPFGRALDQPAANRRPGGDDLHEPGVQVELSPAPRRHLAPAGARIDRQAPERPPSRSRGSRVDVGP
jgi:hypothetical protein